jgi:hypothetical protein
MRESFSDYTIHPSRLATLKVGRGARQESEDDEKSPKAQGLRGACLSATIADRQGGCHVEARRRA